LSTFYCYSKKTMLASSTDSIAAAAVFSASAADFAAAKFSAHCS